MDRWSLEYDISFSKISIDGIWEKSSADSFLDHVIKFLFRVMNFQDIYTQLRKEKKSSLETVTP
jgi:hypothetical protein